MNAKSYAIQIENLYFQWHKNEPAILDLPELIIKRQERVFIKGPSGSGKSTLLSILGGVLLGKKGQVKILGNNIESLSGADRDHFRAQHIGFIFQMFNLIPYLSVIDNVLLPCRFSKKMAREILRFLFSKNDFPLQLVVTRTSGNQGKCDGLSPHYAFTPNHTKTGGHIRPPHYAIAPNHIIG